jgi:hypothetical protein
MKRLSLLLCLSVSSSLLATCPPATFVQTAAGKALGGLFRSAYIQDPKIGFNYVHTLVELDPSQESKVLHQTRTTTHYAKVREYQGKTNVIVQTFRQENDPTASQVTYFSNDRSEYYDELERAWKENIEALIKEPRVGMEFNITVDNHRYFYSWKAAGSIEIGTRKIKNILALEIRDGHPTFPSSILQNIYARGEGLVGYRHEMYSTFTVSNRVPNRVIESRLVAVQRDAPF